ncbi:hypothetical protein PGB90_001432 [Kerria lacca]
MALMKLRQKEISIIIRDFNAKVGDTSLDNYIRTTVGNFGTGRRNVSGEKLIQFALDH